MVDDHADALMHQGVDGGLASAISRFLPALRDVRVCGVLQAVAIARNRLGGDFGLLLEFRDRLGQLKQWNMPCRLLAGRGDELQKALFDQGLDIHYPQRNRLAEYLCQQHPDRTVWIISTPGWFDQVYVLPDRSIGDSSDGVILQSEGNVNSNTPATRSRTGGNTGNTSNISK